MSIVRAVGPFLFSFSLVFSASSFAGADHTMGSTDELPRSYGPFVLGMDEEAFRKLTGVQPESCPICLEQETFANLSPQQAGRLIPAAADQPEGLDFFFLNGRLYHMISAPEFRNLFVARDEYHSRFGRAGRLVEDNAGTAMLRWADEGTVVTVNYRMDDNQVYAVNLYDYNLKEERDWRESLLFEQTAGADLLP